MIDLSREAIARRLTDGGDGAPRGRKQAAVAIALRYRGVAPEVLLMRRASNPEDRWSGQVALPGGRRDPGDVDLVHTAVRETLEEVGVDLEAAATRLGQLAPVRALGRGELRPMRVTPQVFALDAPVEITPNHEVAATLWLPLDAAARGELDSTYRHPVGRLALPFDCWRYRGYVVWGLTHRMLRGFLRALR